MLFNDIFEIFQNFKYFSINKISMNPSLANLSFSYMRSLPCKSCFPAVLSFQKLDQVCFLGTASMRSIQKNFIRGEFKNTHYQLYSLETDLPLAYYLHLSRREQNDHFMFGGLFVTFHNAQIISFTILLLFSESPHKFLAQG